MLVGGARERREGSDDEGGKRVRHLTFVFLFSLSLSLSLSLSILLPRRGAGAALGELRNPARAS